MTTGQHLAATVLGLLIGFGLVQLAESIWKRWPKPVPRVILVVFVTGGLVAGVVFVWGGQ